MHQGGVGPPRGRKVSKVSKKRKLTVAKKDTRAHSSQRLPCKAPRKVMASKAPRKVLATAADLTDWENDDVVANAAAKAEHLVSEILASHKNVDGLYEFQVMWGTGDISWEPSAMLTGCRALVKDFLVESVWPLKINITAPKIKKTEKNKTTVKGTSSNSAPVCYMY